MLISEICFLDIDFCYMFLSNIFFIWLVMLYLSYYIGFGVDRGVVIDFGFIFIVIGFGSIFYRIFYCFFCCLICFDLFFILISFYVFFSYYFVFSMCWIWICYFFFISILFWIIWFLNGVDFRSICWFNSIGVFGFGFG